jgi:hypothetical protein
MPVRKRPTTLEAANTVDVTLRLKGVRSLPRLHAKIMNLFTSAAGVEVQIQRPGDKAPRDVPLKELPYA